MSSSTEFEQTVAAPVGRSWAPSLDLTPTGMARFDPNRVELAVEEGYRVGLQAGQAEAAAAARQSLDAEMAESRARTDAALGALGAAIAEVEQGEHDLAEAFASEVCALAVKISEALIGRELADDTVAAASAVERCLGALGQRSGTVVRLHPADLALLDGADLPDGVHLEPDPTLDRGDATGRCDDRAADARLSSALERVLDALEGRA